MFGDRHRPWEDGIYAVTVLWRLVDKRLLREVPRKQMRVVGQFLLGTSYSKSQDHSRLK